MFENRSAIYHNLAGCVVGTAWGAATSLLGSVAVCRLCGVSPELAVVLGNKGISSPFALAGAAALGANEPLTVTYVILSGVRFGPSREGKGKEKKREETFVGTGVRRRLRTRRDRGSVLRHRLERRRVRRFDGHRLARRGHGHADTERATEARGAVVRRHDPDRRDAHAALLGAGDEEAGARRGGHRAALDFFSK